MPIQSQVSRVPHPHSTVGFMEISPSGVISSRSICHVNMTLSCCFFTVAPGTCVPPHQCGPLHRAVSVSGEFLEEMLDSTVLPCFQNLSLALSYFIGAHVDHSHLLGLSVFWEAVDS